MKFQKLVLHKLSLMLIVICLVSCGTAQVASPSQAPQPTATPIPGTAQAPLNPTVTATSQSALSGKFNVNGQSLFIQCAGTGSPTIVLEPGEGGTHLDMMALQKRLAVRKTTCVYDRAKTARLRTAQEVVDDLHALLVAAKVQGPFVLVGSSAGGLFVQHYARTYPNEVVGVISMNPVPPAHPWLDTVRQIFTAQEYADEQAYYKGNNGEAFDYLTSSEELAAAPEPPDVPFEMLLSTDVQCEGDSICLKSYASYEQILQQVTDTWSRGHFSQVKAGHEIYQSDIDAVVAIVERVLASP